MQAHFRVAEDFIMQRDQLLFFSINYFGVIYFNLIHLIYKCFFFRVNNFFQILLNFGCIRKKAGVICLNKNLEAIIFAKLQLAFSVRCTTSLEFLIFFQISIFCAWSDEEILRQTHSFDNHSKMT